MVLVERKKFELKQLWDLVPLLSTYALNIGPSPSVRKQEGNNIIYDYL